MGRLPPSPGSPPSFPRLGGGAYGGLLVVLIVCAAIVFFFFVGGMDAVWTSNQQQVKTNFTQTLNVSSNFHSGESGGCADNNACGRSPFGIGDIIAGAVPLILGFAVLGIMSKRRRMYG